MPDHVATLNVRLPAAARERFCASVAAEADTVSPTCCAATDGAHFDIRASFGLGGLTRAETERAAHAICLRALRHAVSDPHGEPLQVGWTFDIDVRAG